MCPPSPAEGRRTAGWSWGAVGRERGSVPEPCVCVPRWSAPQNLKVSSTHIYPAHGGGGKEDARKPCGKRFQEGNEQKPAKTARDTREGGLRGGGSLPGGEKVAKGELEKCPAAARADAAPPYRCE